MKSQHYLAGCLVGDACITKGHRKTINGYLRLRCADRDFATAFANAIFDGYGIRVNTLQDRDGYWDIRAYNGWRRFDALKSLRPTYHEEKAAWLRGFFDSEGNAVCVARPKRGPYSWNRRVAMFSTNGATLEAARGFLSDLGIGSRICAWKCGAGHMGDKPVSAVILNSSKPNFHLFASVVGSSISRKQLTLSMIATTYQ